MDDFRPDPLIAQGKYKEWKKKRRQAEALEEDVGHVCADFPDEIKGMCGAVGVGIPGAVLWME